MAAFYGEILVRVTADTKQAEAGLNRMAATSAATATKTRRDWAKIGLGAQNMGRTITQFATIPIAAGFAVAGVAAYKYQQSLMKIQNLTGTSAKQTKMYGDEMLRLGEVTGQTPIRLASAFYFIASSGFQGAEAMKVLNASAKATTAGLGDVMVIADAVTSAVNAYGHENITAARAVDILMKTVQVGKAEPEALAHSLGRIMPIAAQLGVPLEQVGGMIAGLTLGGLSSAEAVTALRGAMIAMTAPAKMSMDELKRLNLTYQDVTKSIRDEGLIATLQMLYEATDGNMLAMRRIIPNVRALNGVMSLLGPNYKKNVEVTKQVTDSHGKLNEAFEHSTKETIVKLQMAWASLQASFIKIGSMLLPLFAGFAKWLADLAAAFGKLPKEIQYFTLGLVALVAVAGPALMVFGSIARTFAMWSINAKAATIETVALGNATQTTATKVGIFSRAMGALPAVGLFLAPIAAILGGMYAFGKAVDYYKAKKREAEYMPKGIFKGTGEQAALFDEGLTKELEKLGYKKRVVEGIVYFDYTVKPRAKGGKAAADAAAEAVWGPFSESLSAQRVKTEMKLQNEFEFITGRTDSMLDKIQARAITRGGENSLAALLGLGGGFEEFSVRPYMDQLRREIDKLSAERSMLWASAAQGAPPWVGLRIDQLDTDIARLRRKLGEAQSVWAEATAKFAAIQAAAPKYELGMGIEEWQAKLDEYAKVTVPDILGAPFKMPPIKIKADTKTVKSQLRELGDYLARVKGTHTLTVREKLAKTSRVVSYLQRQIDKIGVPVTAEARLKKDLMERMLADALLQLDYFDSLVLTPQVTLNTAQAMQEAWLLTQSLNSIPNVTRTVTIYSRNVRPRGEAWGGIIKKPEIVLVGEDGPEAIIPLTKKRRAAQLLKEAGLAQGMERPRIAAPRVRAAAADQPERIPPVVNLITHIHMSGGVIGRSEDVAQELATHSARANERLVARLARGWV